MREFLTISVPIYMYDGQGGYIVKTMGEVFIPLSQTSTYTYKHKWRSMNTHEAWRQATGLHLLLLQLLPNSFGPDDLSR